MVAQASAQQAGHQTRSGLPNLRLDHPRSGGELHLSVLSPSAAEAVVAYQERNWGRFCGVSPTPPPDFFSVSYWHERLLTLQREAELGSSLRMFVTSVRSSSAGGADLQIHAHLSYTAIVRGPLMACFLGYGVDLAHEGTGLMRSALEVGNAYVFETLGLHRIQAGVLPDNARSLHLLERLGFEREGYARSYLRLPDADGREAWRDHVIMALVREEP